jgi:hypothetical protein
MSTRRSIQNHHQFADIIAALKSGKSVDDVASRFDVNPKTLAVFKSNNKKKYGFPRTGSRDGTDQVQSSVGASVSIDGDYGTATSRVFTEQEADSLSDTDLLKAWKLNPDTWEIIDGSLGVNRWMVTAVDKETGESIERWNYQYKARVRRRQPEAEALPKHVTVDVNVSVVREPARRRTDLKCAVIFPDSQIGYWRDRNETWHTFHDEGALSITHQILADLQAEHGIDTVIDLGDFIDATPFSRHRSAPAQIDRAHLHRAIVRAQQELATRAKLTPNAQRHLIPGNHEQRIINWLTDNAPFLLGFQRPSDDAPLLSLAFLLDISRHGWQLAADYPEGEVLLNSNTRCIHGTIAKGVPGASAAEYLRDEMNTFFGHTPRAQTAHRTVARGAGTRTYVAHTPGGLMRVDGAVPSGTTAINSHGDPALKRGERWEQGFSVVFYSEDGTTVPLIEHIPIFGGRAVWRGREYTATCDPDGNAIKVRKSRR